MFTKFSELVIGERGHDIIMRKKTNDSELPIGKLIKVPDFLPPPEDLVILEDTIKVTLALKKSSVDFLKREARRHHTKYQKMIREIVDRYARQYQN